MVVGAIHSQPQPPPEELEEELDEEEVLVAPEELEEELDEEEVLVAPEELEEDELDEETHAGNTIVLQEVPAILQQRTILLMQVGVLNVESAH